MIVTYTKNIIKWVYNDKKYEYKIDSNIVFIKKNEKNRFIYICSNNANTSTYITFEGNFIMSFISNNNNGKIVILNDKEEKSTLLCDTNIYGVTLNSKNILVALNGKEPKIIMYSLHGKKLKEYAVEKGYTIQCFCSMPENDIEIKIICEKIVDKPFKVYYYLLNLETGKWTFLYSMYDR